MRRRPTGARADDADGPRRSGATSPRPTPVRTRRGAGFVVRTDGAARGNPGPASAGAVLIDAARPDARHPLAPPDASISDFLGVQTNNVAEYTGVVRALDPRPRSSARREVAMLLDSKLIVEQLAGRWRVKDAKLIPLWEEARGGRSAASSAGPPTTCRGPRTRPRTRWRTRRSTGSRRAGRRRSSGGREPDRRGASGAG